ncbi:AAA family ATPase, partial [Candidatus Gracilibacteria bacterium]|nr:AAA family ATPase [Candidatus Gracilibacteria bacterium]
MLNQRSENTLWVEKYRPTTLNDFIGNDTVKAKIKSFIDGNDINHLLFTGPAGVGKTTCAKIIVNSLECDYIYINASDENSIDVLRNKIKSFVSSVGFKDLKIVILDEADGTTVNFQSALRNLQETFSKHSRFILTCNYLEKIIEPIKSRCQLFEIFPPSKAQVAKRLLEILQKENVIFTKEDIAFIVNAEYP